MSSGKAAAGILLAAVGIVAAMWFTLPSEDEMYADARRGGTRSSRDPEPPGLAPIPTATASAPGATETPPAAPAPNVTPTPADAEATPSAPPMGRGFDHPLLALMDSGKSFTADAAAAVDMRSLPAGDPRYDAITEAGQIFAGFEEALRAARPLDAARFRKVGSEWKERNRAVLERAQELRKAGRAEDAKVVMEEWSRLYGIYQAEAYGRAPPPSGSP